MKRVLSALSGLVGILAFASVVNLVCNTVWYNWFDAEMVVLEDRFESGNYGHGLSVASNDQAPDGVIDAYKGGIFKERDDHLLRNHIVHSCRWTSHYATGEGEYTNAMCAYFWWPFG